MLQVHLSRCNAWGVTNICYITTLLRSSGDPKKPVTPRHCVDAIRTPKYLLHHHTALKQTLGQLFLINKQSTGPCPPIYNSLLPRRNSDYDVTALQSFRYMPLKNESFATYQRTRFCLISAVGLGLEEIVITTLEHAGNIGQAIGTANRSFNPWTVW